MLELTRYVVLNPVRAGRVSRPGNWPWSSYRAMTGKTPAPAWPVTAGILALFAKRRTTAQQRYREFVKQGIKSASIWGKLQQPIYLDDERFVKRVQRKVGLQGDELSIPRAQRRAPAPALAKIAAKYHERNDAIYAAYATGAYSYRENIMACTLRQWVGLSEGGCYNTRTDPVTLP